MSSSPGIESSIDSPLLELRDTSSKEPSERGSSPTVYTSLAMEVRAVCIPSPYADGSQDYAPQDYSPEHLSYYRPSMLEYSRPSLSEDPTIYWGSHGGHNMPSVSLQCPPPAVVYRESNTHCTWAETKPHDLSSSSLMSTSKISTRSLEEDGLNSSTSSSSSLGFGGKMDMHFCAVCHDYASGYHYGVWSCEGCKAFFKRSIQGHNDYLCPATNQCTIDKTRRKSCQACRLQKCYEVGMMKCGVRRERFSYRGARHRRHAQVNDGPVGRSQRRHEVSLALTHPVVSPIGSHRPSDGQISPFSLSPEQLIVRILEAEPPQIYLAEQLQKPYTESSMMMSLTHLADKELVLMISWAKKIPGFVELCLSYQVHLLECCWLEVLMLGLMWRSVDHPGKLIFSPDLKLNREEGSCVEGIMEIFDMLLAATSRFRELKLQKEEYVCLKAMILLNSNMCTGFPKTSEEVESRGKLLRLLDSVTDALVWTISRTGLSDKEQSARLAHLLMLLSHIRHLSNKGMEHLSTMKKKNVVLLYDLLLEMLDANTAHNYRPVASAKGPESGPSCLSPQSPASELAGQALFSPQQPSPSQGGGLHRGDVSEDRGSEYGGNKEKMEVP
ncbi:estrogen receptor 2b isoform X2 [Denticeps clupeoides]|nr:estrogen receptor beta isoform X2 [Denticeps clupeoides]